MAVLSLKETWMMVVTILVITLPDRGGLRSFTPLLNLQLAIVRQFKETKLERDLWSFRFQETKSPRSLRDREHSSLKVIRLRV